ncbi:hypothetical protein N0V87_008733 [Didymella glomerata]|uniref:Uncharacterized protein n=1 Tax=Didymella glomerata TaxID=749621 RepID=A0A9W8WSJ0_9PLEO|nr:hypothetical protein N0V87_008733 [Didymella glomerata]
MSSRLPMAYHEYNMRMRIGKTHPRSPGDEVLEVWVWWTLTSNSPKAHYYKSGEGKGKDDKISIQTRDSYMLDLDTVPEDIIGPLTQDLFMGMHREISLWHWMGHFKTLKRADELKAHQAELQTSTPKKVPRSKKASQDTLKRNLEEDEDTEGSRKRLMTPKLKQEMKGGSDDDEEMDDNDDGNTNFANESGRAGFTNIDMAENNDQQDEPEPSIETPDHATEAVKVKPNSVVAADKRRKNLSVQFGSKPTIMGSTQSETVYDDDWTEYQDLVKGIMSFSAKLKAAKVKRDDA